MWNLNYDSLEGVNHFSHGGGVSKDGDVDHHPQGSPRSQWISECRITDLHNGNIYPNETETVSLLDLIDDFELLGATIVQLTVFRLLLQQVGHVGVDLSPGEKNLN